MLRILLAIVGTLVTVWAADPDGRYLQQFLLFLMGGMMVYLLVITKE